MQRNSERKRDLKTRLAGEGVTISQVAREVEPAVAPTTAAKIIGAKYPLRSVRSRRTRARVLQHCAQVLGVDVTELERELDAAAA